MKKDSLVIAIGKMKPKGMKHNDDSMDDNSMNDDSEESSESDIGLESAFEDLVHAIKSNDSAAGIEALKAFIEQCNSSDYEDDDEDKEEDHSDSGF